jgi:hypothetical protein
MVMLASGSACEVAQGETGPCRSLVGQDLIEWPEWMGKRGGRRVVETLGERCMERPGQDCVDMLGSPYVVAVKAIADP